jgi:hypothetical protein
VYTTFNNLHTTNTYFHELYKNSDNCQAKMKFECQIKEGDRIYFKNENQNIEGKVKKLFKLFSQSEINDYAFITVNENNLELVINVKELSLSSLEENNNEKFQAFEKYYLVKYRFEDIEAGKIFCLFEDSVTREKKIYSRDLDVLITGNIANIIIKEINENRSEIYFKEISKKMSKFLYSIQPINKRLDIDIMSMDSIKSGSFVKFRQENIIKYVAVHQIIEIGGFNFLILHVNILMSLLLHFRFTNYFIGLFKK